MKKDGYWNYDKSEFDKVGPVLEDDDALEALWKRQYSLTAITAPDQFKSFDDLESIMEYKKGSTQYVSETLVRGDNIRLFD